jgi:hypothetical protein
VSDQRETMIAMREAHHIASSDAYFNARHFSVDTRDRRLCFEAGFNRGFEAERDLIESLAAQLAEERKQHDKSRADAHALADSLEEQLAAAQSRLAEIEAQEPVAWASENVVPLRGNGDNHPAILTPFKCAANTVPLYARPVTPAAQTVAPAADLVREGLDYFERSGDAGDKKYVAAIRAALASQQPAAPAADIPDIRTTLGFIFGRFHHPDDAREIPDDVVAAVRRLERAVGPDTIVMRAKRALASQQPAAQGATDAFGVRLTSTEDGVWVHFDGPNRKAGINVSVHPIAGGWAAEYKAFLAAQQEPRHD